MGEKQRIGIARAIYRDAKIIIMDEMSNFLDQEIKIKLLKIFMNISMTEL